MCNLALKWVDFFFFFSMKNSLFAALAWKKLFLVLWEDSHSFQLMGIISPVWLDLGKSWGNPEIIWHEKAKTVAYLHQSLTLSGTSSFIPIVCHVNLTKKGKILFKISHCAFWKQITFCKLYYMYHDLQECKETQPSQNQLKLTNRKTTGHNIFLKINK